MNSTATPFRVLPWDFFADDDAPAPHVEALQISGAPRQFELLQRGARVYFRLLGDDTRVWATLDNSGNADFVRTFRRAIGSGRFGRVFDRERDGFQYEHRFYFSLLMSVHGEVQAREWCATRWFEMEADSPKLSRYLKSNPKLSVFHPKWAPPFREVLQENWPLFYVQPFGDADRRLTRNRFFVGNAAHLEQLTRAYLWINRPAHGFPGNSANFYVNERNYSLKPTSAPAALRANLSVFPTSVHELIAAHFQVGGVDWESEVGLDKRQSWQWDIGYYRAEVPENSTFSAHEKLENYLSMRDWLQGKLAPARISEILDALRV